MNDAGSKFAPATVRVKADPPAVIVLGLIAESEGMGLATVKACAAEIPPPGAGLKMVTLIGPGATRSPARMTAVSVELLTKEVLRLAPFHWTTEAGSKLAPATVRVKAGPPATAAVGLMLDSPGAGSATVKAAWEDVPPPGGGLKIAILSTAGAMMSPEVIATFRVELLMNVVVRLDPFHCTTEVGSKFAPVTVRVKAEPPAVAKLGFRLEMAAFGLAMVMLAELESPPPGVEVKTVTL
jgi:hypothetical protein